MRIILSLDEELLAQARLLTGQQDASTVVNEALKALVARESARRLALLGGTESELKPVPRRRPSPAGITTRVARLVAHLRGRGVVAMSTDEIMALT